MLQTEMPSLDSRTFPFALKSQPKITNFSDQLGRSKGAWVTSSFFVVNQEKSDHVLPKIWSNLRYLLGTKSEKVECRSITKSVTKRFNANSKLQRFAPPISQKWLSSDLSVRTVDSYWPEWAISFDGAYHYVMNDFPLLNLSGRYLDTVHSTKKASWLITLAFNNVNK